MSRRSATAEVEVAADPARAFDVFTSEIDAWWVRGAINFFDAARAIEMKIEPGVDGRVLEVYEGDALELGRITAWEPGERLAYRSRVDDSEVDVRFESVEGGTRVRVTQTLVPGGEKMFDFWPRTLAWFGSWLGAGRPKEIAPLSFVLYYESPVGPRTGWSASSSFARGRASSRLRKERGSSSTTATSRSCSSSSRVSGARSRTCRGCTWTTSTPTSLTPNRRVRPLSRASTSTATGLMWPKTSKGGAGPSRRHGRRCGRG